MPRHGILIIDMLNDFATEQGALFCPGATTIIEPLQKLMAWVRERNAKASTTFKSFIFKKLIELRMRTSE